MLPVVVESGHRAETAPVVPVTPGEPVGPVAPVGPVLLRRASRHTVTTATGTGAFLSLMHSALDGVHAAAGSWPKTPTGAEAR